MDYIYVDKFDIDVDNMNNNDNNDEEFINNMTIHLNKYRTKYNIEYEIYINKFTCAYIEEYISDHGYQINKKKLVTYLILSENKIYFNIGNDVTCINCEKSSIVIFPSEWFISFKLERPIVYIGNTFI